MSYRVTFSKDRQKFSAAHFTIFEDGEVERLHGHNYYVVVTLSGEALSSGLVFPFHEVKPVISALCKTWDEYVLLPTRASWLAVETRGDQIEARLETPRVSKRYSFPREDVILLDCDNISSENLARLFLEMLTAGLASKELGIAQIEVSISESRGQSVTVGRPL